MRARDLPIVVSDNLLGDAAQSKGPDIIAQRIPYLSRLEPEMKAGLYVMLGDKDRAIELLENGLDQGYSSVRWANVWPQFDPLRDDPRFQDLLRRMNFEP